MPYQAGTREPNWYRWEGRQPSGSFERAHAYATTELEGGGLQHIVKQLGYGDDPLNQRASVGWKAVKTAERLSEQYMVRIESCSARYSASALAN